MKLILWLSGKVQKMKRDAYFHLIEIVQAQFNFLVEIFDQLFQLGYFHVRILENFDI
jgi:hypothetical protein